MSVYSQPWWPNQKLLARPSFCITAIHWPANEPTTMMIRLTNRQFTPSFWYFGSCPEIDGTRYRTGASHAVAIQRMASWVCQLRVHATGRDREGKAVGRERGCQKGEKQR